ncbi:DUF3891 family protein [Alteribacter aurantiacus]|uniref:DUF3891 family protein n=1 Tax=Alteribacter aurantiacus TaxID=254410 RepID=UPI0004286C27|nr:DUF3891 family protein [Alteribacter aurantiacus]
MIVREDKEGYYLFEQDRHAHLSGVFCEAWEDRFFKGLSKKRSVSLAITHHDRGWAALDKEMMLHHRKLSPLSFIDYPLKKKITAYEKGVDEMEEIDVYSALLMSMHYTSFFKGKLDRLGCDYRSKEENRQDRMKKKLLLSPRETNELDFHYDLLQFTDNLSLYVCMNEWGIEKEREVSWFMDGFPQQFDPLINERIQARWLSPSKVCLWPYPFYKSNLTVVVPYKYLKKELIEIGEAQKIYNTIPFRYHMVTFVQEGDM